MLYSACSSVIFILDFLKPKVLFIFTYYWRPHILYIYSRLNLTNIFHITNILI
jgi:hypothetical protein